MADTTPNQETSPIVAPQALPEQPLQNTAVTQPTPQPQVAPTPVQPQPVVPVATQTAPVQPATQATPATTPTPVQPNLIQKFKLYIIIFASVIGLSTVGYIAYSFFFSEEQVSNPPTVSSPFEETATETTTPAEDSNPPSLGGSSTTSQNNELGKTIQDLQDASTGTEKVYDNAVLEETTPSTMEVTKKIPR